MSFQGQSLRAARASLAARLREAGIEEPEADARVLIRHATGADPALPGAAAERVLEPAECAALEALAVRRLAREPVARIVGTREFFGLPLTLNAACLVPRPDTETVVEAALARLPKDRPVRALDLGTGPGTILLAILSERPQAEGLGIDLSEEALVAARANAQALGLAGRVDFRRGDWMTGVVGPFELIVSNPPYIPSADCETLQAEVRDHDPRLALDGGPDGLAAYRAICAAAGPLLKPGGHLVLELGIGQAMAVARLGREAGLSLAGLASDLAGIPRALVFSL